MRQVMLFTMIVAAFLSCKEEAPYTISQDKMVNIMLDMTYADDIIRRYPGISRDSVQIELMKSLLKIHKVDYSELESNLYLYQQDMDLYKSMLDDIKHKLDSIKSRIDTEQEVTNE